MAGSDAGAGDTAGSKEEKVSTVKSSKIMEHTKKGTDIPVRQHIITPTPLLAYVFTLSSTIPFYNLTTANAPGCYTGTLIRTVGMERNVRT